MLRSFGWLPVSFNHVIMAMFIDWLVDRGDPLSNMEVTFATKEDATAFCEKNGNWFVCGLRVCVCVCVCVCV